MNFFSRLLFLFFLFPSVVYGQNEEVTKRKTVGLVLSGGGAKGGCYAGVIKALEENNIPIDYICGTSIGGLVGGFYAAGYNADDLVEIVGSDDFYEWSEGTIPDEMLIDFGLQQKDAGFISFPLKLDPEKKTTTFEARNIVDDSQINFAFPQHMYQATYQAKGDFDSLPIPFRCVASEIFTQEEVVLKSGSLGKALRATMAVPLYFGPTKVDGRYLFDGGVYNNFPISVMREEFNPDIIIAVNVSPTNLFDEYPYENDEELVNSPLEYMLISNAKLSWLKKGDIYIQPDLHGVEFADFRKGKELIKYGYDATIKSMDSILTVIGDDRSTRSGVSGAKMMNFDKQKVTVVKIESDKSSHKKFIRHFFSSSFDEKNEDVLTLSGYSSVEDVKVAYNKLLSIDYFKRAEPHFEQISDDTVVFKLGLSSEPKLHIGFGGNLSSQNITTGYLKVSHQFLNNNLNHIEVNTYLGQFYTSFQARGSVLVPKEHPFLLEASYTRNWYDYFSRLDIITNEKLDLFARMNDRYLEGRFKLPLGNKFAFSAFAGYSFQEFNYANNADTIVFASLTPDITKIESVLGGISVGFNTLNSRNLASKGSMFNASLKYFDGREFFSPGSTSKIIEPVAANHSWFTFKSQFQKYFGEKKVRWGVYGEVFLSDLPLLVNYSSTMLNYEQFNPLIDSKGWLINDHRADNYLALGGQNIIQLKESLELRTELYLFAPVFGRTVEGSDQKPYKDYTAAIDDIKSFNMATIGAMSLVYRTPIGPLSFQGNYYSARNSFGLFVNIGYILYNKSARD